MGIAAKIRSAGGEVNGGGGGGERRKKNKTSARCHTQHGVKPGMVIMLHTQHGVKPGVVIYSANKMAEKIAKMTLGNSCPRRDPRSISKW